MPELESLVRDRGDVLTYYCIRLRGGRNTAAHCRQFQVGIALRSNLHDTTVRHIAVSPRCTNEEVAVRRACQDALSALEPT